MASSTDLPLDGIRKAAAEKERNYEWLAAADLYQRALTTLDSPQVPLEVASLTELVARSYYKAAFQAEGREEFNQRMQMAHTWYEKAQVIYDEASSEGLSKMSKARGISSTFWLEEGPGSKKEIAGRCVEVAGQGARVLEREGNRKDLAQAQMDLLTYLVEAQNFVGESEPLKGLLEKAIRIGEEAIAGFEALGDNEGLLDSLYNTLTLLGSIQLVFESSRFQGLMVKAGKIMKRLAEVSEKADTAYAACLANEAAAWTALRLEGDQSRALKLLESARSMAVQTRDSLLIGRVLSEIADASFRPGAGADYGQGWREVLERGIECASTAIRELKVSCHGGWLEYVYSCYAECYISLAIFVETDREKKKEFLRKAVEIARAGSKYEDHTWLTITSHVLSKAMYYLATMNIESQEKAQLLREALPIREEAVRLHEHLNPQSWNVGVARNYLALVKAELSVLEQDPTVKRELLKGAVLDMENCVELCGKWSANPADLRALAIYEEGYGDVLLQLHQLAGQASMAQRAVKAYNEAIVCLSSIEHHSSMAPLRWKIAEVWDSVGSFKEATQAFKTAAEDYSAAAKKIPGSGSVFGDLASYMEAWSMIEEARVHHNEEQNLLAAESYSKASSLLNTTRAWGHLSKHYAACSFLEGGEALSRQERQEASIESFTAAVKAFREAGDDVAERMKGTLGSHEKRELRDWARITEGRQRYCLGRIELEEAKILDRKGEDEASGTKYRSASEVFRGLHGGARSEQDRTEFETLVLFCDGWARMKDADTRASPDLYSEAAKSFLKIEKVHTRKRVRLLARANAHMCNALESGAHFRRTRDLQLYSTIKSQLETGADYYEEAGFKNAADWTRATQRLFDALAYMATAEVKLEPKKKTQLYHLAEKHLDLAAKLYGDAGFPSKSDEILRHLKRTRQEKELLLTPVEALAGNPAASGISPVAPITLTADQAVGLERFGTANVVGNLGLSQREFKVGSDFTVELELANVGKTTATLVKLENLTPEGLEIDREKISFRIEDDYIDLKWKRLEYLKTHEVKIAMKAARKGSFELRPRVLFLDEKGSYRSYEFEPTLLTVRELGISGWLKGPG